MHGWDKRVKSCACWHAENRQHLFTAIDAGFTLEERMELDSPVELLDSLLFILGVMLDQLIVRAQSRILALATITLRLVSGGWNISFPHRTSSPPKYR